LQNDLFVFIFPDSYSCSIVEISARLFEVESSGESVSTTNTRRVAFLGIGRLVIVSVLLYPMSRDFIPNDWISFESEESFSVESPISFSPSFETVMLKSR